MDWLISIIGWGVSLFCKLFKGETGDVAREQMEQAAKPPRSADDIISDL